jgi:hypothetical protein
MRTEVIDQFAHDRKIRRVVHEATGPPLMDETSAAQLLDVEGQRRRRDAQPFSELPGRRTRRTTSYQQPVEAQAMLLSQCGKGRERALMVHD